MEDQKHTPGPVVAVKTGRSGKDFERNWRELRTESGRCITWSGEYHSNLYGTVAGVAIQETDARLLAAAYTSYDKHCGERAVECAEGDLLGELLHACEETLRDVECRFDGIDFEMIERRLSDVLAKGCVK